jgi:hypothetical protein
LGLLRHGAVAGFESRRSVKTLAVTIIGVSVINGGVARAGDGRRADGLRAESSARADGGTSRVSLITEVTCDPLPGPGKVQCVVRVRPLGGALRWSDAIVLGAPTFAPPLRTRVAVGDAKRNDSDGADFSLALAATADGVGELKVLARATVCGDGGCRPVQAEGVAKVVVGAASGSPR